VNPVITASLVVYFVVLLGVLVACLLRRVEWRRLAAAAIPVFVAVGIVCLGLLFVALLGRGERNATVGARAATSSRLPWR